MHKKRITPSIMELFMYDFCVLHAQIRSRAIILCLVVLLVCLIGCSQIQTIPIGQANESPESFFVYTIPPTLATETALPSTLAPSLTSMVSHCRESSIMFEASGIAGSASPSVYLACADGSWMHEITSDPLLFIDNLSLRADMRVWVTEKGDSLELTKPFGQDIVKLLLDDTEKGRISSPTWSPNGDYIAYLRDVAKGDGRYSYNRVDIVHVATEQVSPGFIPEDEFEGNQIEQGWEWIQWSPVADQILLYSRQKPLAVAEVSCENSTHVCTAKIRPIGVKASRKYPNRPWAPNGQKIAYACYSTSTTGVMLYEGLCVQDTDGVLTAEFKESDFGIEDIDAIAWSPDGTRVAFTARLMNEKATDIFILSLDNTTIYNLTSDLTGDQVSPTWIR